MCTYKIWTDEEVSKLINYVSEYGKTKGITKFSNETGRSVDSTRRKLLRINEVLTPKSDKFGVINAVDSYEDLPNETPCSKDETEPKSWFKRFRDWILFR